MPGTGVVVTDISVNKTDKNSCFSWERQIIRKIKNYIQFFFFLTLEREHEWERGSEGERES